MKLNFKYVSMLACAALMAGFTSCSNDDEAAVEGLLPNGKVTTARFILNQTGTTTRAASATPTDDEKAIKNATLYVFNNSQVLEKVVNFTNTNTSPVVEITSGGHYFLAAVNAPAVTGIEEGKSTLGSVEKIIAEVALASITNAAKGFFMTNVDGAVSKNLAVNVENAVDINVGRAMAKVALTCADGDDATSLSGPNGKLLNVKYVTANNPAKMYYFPVIEAGIYKAPYYADQTVTDANYLPALKYTDSYAAIGAMSVAPGTNSYLMENANEKVKKGNMSYLLISGKFEPSASLLKNKDNTASAVLPASGTFYRLYNVNNDEYYDMYIVADAKTDIDPTKFTYDALPTTDPSGKGKGHTVNVIEYKDGISYYAFALENNENADPISKFTAKRNVCYDVTLNKVMNAGASVPNINGNNDGNNTDDTDYIPGTGGGDGGGNNNDDTNKGGKEEPVEGVCKIKGTITVLPWTVVSQNGGIGY
ncbi:Mfa1 family fimbria major subunit [Bacteroides sp. 224]|uniref:Mfa1 family fimbria major subunit n=1 Tax=Bacteroides sp. 224 TaxID=2302936 RepID=UPI0013D1897D|nr:Mfa1 family fimbria major subunit [Bacteroides sp. 224]NDV66421.1 hypothetical protein [Bacteroides sp. 224]